MLRLAILVSAAVVLPAAGAKPSQVINPANVAPTVTAAWAPKMRFPHLPHFKRNRGAEVQLAQMNTRLRNLVLQQETWFVAHQLYGRDVNKMASLAPGDSAAANHVQVQILYAGAKGWTAMASHPDAPGKSCIVYVGVRERLPLIPRTRADGTEAQLEGIPACDVK